MPNIDKQVNAGLKSPKKPIRGITFRDIPCAVGVYSPIRRGGMVDNRAAACLP